MILLQKTLTDGRYETANTCAFSLKGLAPQVQKLLSIFTAPGTTRPEKIVQHPAWLRGLPGAVPLPLPHAGARGLRLDAELPGQGVEAMFDANLHQPATQQRVRAGLFPMETKR